jgi:hypothetical protein
MIEPMDSKELARSKVDRAEAASEAARGRVRAASHRLELALGQRSTAGGVIYDVQAFRLEVEAARKELDEALAELRRTESRWPTLGDFSDAGY